ncbi:MAG: hypothetical protein J5757_03220 [Lachnospiraceae bacterium]|nr:hypothetical protein [Lachnospiraceae bacterium]
MKKRIVALICCITVVVMNIALCFANEDDYESIQEGYIDNCHVVAKNYIRADKKYANAYTTISGTNNDSSVSVTATYYYVGVSGNYIGMTGVYNGGNSGPTGCDFPKNVPNDNYRFYRAESTHYAYYHQGVFYVPSLVTIP